MKKEKKEVNIGNKIGDIFKKVVNSLKNIDKKKLIIGSGIAVLILIGAIVIILVVNRGNEKELTKELENMGRDFYESYYYEMTGKTTKERKSFLEKYKENGIKINIDNLSRYNSKVNKEKVKLFVNSKTKKKCDLEESKVTIYPQDPYELKDYKIEVDLVCGFDKK